MQRVLPSAAVKDKLVDLTVGLAADCDRPESQVEQLMRSNLAGATGLPFVALLAHDGSWITGYSAKTDASTLLKALERAEKHPSIQASPADRKKLAGLVKRATRSAEKEDWRGVVREYGKAKKIRGRCTERTELEAIMQKARDWAELQFKANVRKAAKGIDLDAVEDALKDIKRDFRGEPEEEDAEKGLDALDELRDVIKKEKDGRDDELRAKKAEEFKDSRWKQIFTGADSGESVIEGLD